MEKLKFYLFSIVALLCCISANAQMGCKFTEGGLYYYAYDIHDTETEVCGYTNAMPKDVVIHETVSYEGKTFNVTSIQNAAFRGCTSLTSIDLKNVNTIRNGAFSNCTSLYRP